MALTLHLSQFDGPLDMLLFLIGKAKIDIKDIFVSEVTDQYIQSVQSAPDLDMDDASAFISMAATLLEIKSRALLPKPPKEEEEDPEPEEDDEYQLTQEDRDDMGYDITFNTTISCVITNAIITKAQANKLASILHDAYARAIKPVHTTMDGDTVFVLSTCTQKVNFDAFAALATDVLQYAIIDGAHSAESAYGLPAARDITRK